MGCSKHGFKRVNTPWARPGSGFTLLYEQGGVDPHTGNDGKRRGALRRRYRQGDMAGGDALRLQGHEAA